MKENASKASIPLSTRF